MKIETMIIVLCLFIAMISSLGGYAIAECNIVNKLCKQQNYDFCEVASYKLKGNLK